MPDPVSERPDPVVETTGAREIAPDLMVVPDRHIPLVPNIGVVAGIRSVLVVDTGLGPRNAQQVLTFAAGYAQGRRLYLTTTHFHPEHAFGAQVFAGQATYVLNRTQAGELAAKGEFYLDNFRGLGGPVARALEGATPTAPDVIYDGSCDLDLGGRVVQLRPAGRAHTKGDQVITVPDAGVMFTGDLAETAQFAIFPWYPPYDRDVSGARWIGVLQRLIDENPRVVVPGHGDIGGPERLTDVRDYLTELRDETWRRRSARLSLDTIIKQVRPLMIQRHPGWAGQEWIEPGVASLYTEHAA